MNNPFDFFEEIWCINLDRRPDRWESVVKEFDTLGIRNKVQRLSAITHEDGRIGLIKSILNLLIYEKEKKLKNILILEDDVKFLHANNVTSTLTKANEQISNIDWHMFYLGANINGVKQRKVSENLIRITNSYCSHAICYNSCVYDIIIEQFTKTNAIIVPEDDGDVYFSILQKSVPCFCVNPIIATQSTGFSDLSNAVIDYSVHIEIPFSNNII